MKQRLIDAVIKNKDRLSYVNLNDNNEYKGWVDDFNLKLPNDKKMRLDLSKESDLFLLFVLATSWSKTGPWENAAYFTTYLKYTQKYSVKSWLDKAFVELEISNRKQSAKTTLEECKGITPRKKVSFRNDYYSSIAILAESWEEIKAKINESNLKSDFYIFIEYISKIEGLGAGNNKMRIKIPLILRELRCQGIYDNIPGELCCVPDERVKISSEEIGIKLPHISSLESLMKASKIIYDNFGELYDIPLFAFDDVKSDFN